MLPGALPLTTSSSRKSLFRTSPLGAIAAGRTPPRQAVMPPHHHDTTSVSSRHCDLARPTPHATLVRGDHPWVHPRGAGGMGTSGRFVLLARAPSRGLGTKGAQRYSYIFSLFWFSFFNRNSRNSFKILKCIENEIKLIKIWNKLI
jgi:hypothetical protein